MGSEYSILIIDDEEYLRISLSKMLNVWGYCSAAVSSGKAGLELFRQSPADLVILDLKMPGENGMDFVEPMREIKRGVPILILTAHASLESALQAVRKGATDYFLKPVDPAFLENRLSEIFREIDKERNEQRVLNQIGMLLGELGENTDPPGTAVQKIGVTRVDNLLTCGSIVLDLQTMIVHIHNEIVHLSPTATRYLIALMKAYPETVTVVDLVREAQGYQVNLSEARDLARWRIHEIRKIFQDMKDRPEIQTARGLGYRLVV